MRERVKLKISSWGVLCSVRGRVCTCHGPRQRVVPRTFSTGKESLTKEQIGRPVGGRVGVDENSLNELWGHVDVPRLGGRDPRVVGDLKEPTVSTCERIKGRERAGRKESEGRLSRPGKVCERVLPEDTRLVEFYGGSIPSWMDTSRPEVNLES